MSNFSEINSKLNYNRIVPYRNSEFQNISETPSFEKFQEFNNQKSSFGNNQKNQYTSFDDCFGSGDEHLALKGKTYTNDVSKLFFSAENKKRIQKQIKREIYNRTNGQYKLSEDQDDADLLIAMKAVYEKNSRHLGKYPVRQVKDLNQKLVDSIVPDMITNIKQYYGYIKDITQPIEPIMRPMDVGRRSRLPLPSLTSTWGF